jgi:hypothetical protein
MQQFQGNGGPSDRLLYKDGCGIEITEPAAPGTLVNGQIRLRAGYPPG